MRRAIWTTNAGGVILLAPIFLLLTEPATADVKAGVDAWQQGDFVRAVGEWRSYADAGDADAQFNMGQAYRLGRGVPTDIDAAVVWFRKAAAQGHVRAEDNYGLLLFQQNQRATAMPYLERSAARGVAQAQYILGTALFNGENVQKDWIRAYAMMTRAAASGLEQARTSLAQMDNYIPADQRQKGTALAATMEKQERTTIASVPSPPLPSAAPRPGISPPVRSTELPPSNATGRPPRPAPPETIIQPPPVMPVPVVKAPVKPVPVKPVPVKAVPAPTSAPAAPDGKWRVQLGAFSEESRARTLWSSLEGKVPGLSAYQPYLVRAGDVTRLQAGPLANSADATKLCAKIKAAGADCILKAP